MIREQASPGVRLGRESGGVGEDAALELGEREVKLHPVWAHQDAGESAVEDTLARRIGRNFIQQEPGLGRIYLPVTGAVEIGEAVADLVVANDRSLRRRRRRVNLHEMVGGNDVIVVWQIIGIANEVLTGGVL